MRVTSDHTEAERHEGFREKLVMEPESLFGGEVRNGISVTHEGRVKS